jgi:hypothetical protein
LILREEFELQVFDNRLLRRIFELMMDGENCILGSFIIFALHQIKLSSEGG